MKLIIRVDSGEIAKLPIEMLIGETQPGWKTFSCKRRINEYCDEDGWKMLEEAINEAHTLYKMTANHNVFDFNATHWERLKILIPWAASIVCYGTTGIKL